MKRFRADFCDRIERSCRDVVHVLETSHRAAREVLNGFERLLQFMRDDARDLPDSACVLHGADLFIGLCRLAL